MMRQNSTISEILANNYMNVSVDNSDHDGVVRIFLRSSWVLKHFITYLEQFFP